MPPQTSLPSLTIIVATTPSLGMGYLGSFPWPTFKPDLAFFARVTKRPPPPPPAQSPSSPPRKSDNNDIPYPPNNHHQPTPGGKRTSTATSINALVMGRKTWASIPASRRPLADRVNVIITRQPSALAAEFARTGPGQGVGADGKQHVLVAGSLEEALQRLVRDYPPLPPPPPPPPPKPSSQSRDGEGGAGGGADEVSHDAVMGEPPQQPPPPPLGRVFVIGGAEIYARALRLHSCERILRTLLHREWPADVWFPSSVFVDPQGDADADADSSGNAAGEEGEDQGGRLWTRRSDDELDRWCGESVGGEKQHRDESGFSYRVEMWARNRGVS